MKNSLREKYEKFDKEKLQSILIAKKGTYKGEAIKVAKEILEERGHNIGVDQLLFEKFNEYGDEALTAILISEKGAYEDREINAAKKILEERGNNADVEQLFFYAYDQFSGEDLNKILAEKKETLQDQEVDAIKMVLKEKEPKEKTNWFSVSVGIIFLLCILFRRLSKYNTTEEEMWESFLMILPIAVILFLIVHAKRK